MVRKMKPRLLKSYLFFSRPLSACPDDWCETAGGRPLKSLTWERTTSSMNNSLRGTGTKMKDQRLRLRISCMKTRPVRPQFRGNARHQTPLWCLLLLLSTLLNGCIMESGASSDHRTWTCRWKTMDEVTPEERGDWQHLKPFFPSEQQPHD
jgi:hypothetical protein